MKRALALALLCLAACKKPADVPGTVATQPAQGDAGPAGWSAAKVQAFVTYQKGMLDLLGPAPLPDGGLGKPSPRGDEELARAEDALRKASGLSDPEIATLNTLGAALFTRQVMLKVTAVTSMSHELEKARAELPDGSVPEIDHALAAANAAEQRTGRYEPERARFGDALVDAALPFEKDLVANFGTMMNSAPDEH